ncbi:MAG TPA: UDP-N-acetylglucosamine 2-epimerase (non-hydrolyzing) [Gaiellaceae bacterium]|jgi:UDP-N-acetylglucosamine 2-epimerase|nr:UDP-N-acetylglucosamine 2-epimerase (non-hydrolyzing) [Gaiellaceae bacterium]
MKVFSVIGNRPQFVKAAPTSVALRARGIDEVVLHTGQHYDRELSDVFFEELELEEPRYALDLRTADTAEMEAAIMPALQQERPDWVLVYGDTNSTLAGALAALDAEVPVAHVEAGLRSGDLSMPEERNRIEVDRLAALLFCPDDRSREQLDSEGVPGRAEVVGDVMADATRLFEPIARNRVDVHALAGDAPYDVLTIHREANTEPDRLRRVLEAVGATGRRVVFPVHPRTRQVIHEQAIGTAENVEQIRPVGYLEMLALVSGAQAVVTDSGGLQKEAYWLRVPCVTLRPSTEWVDTVLAGGNTLVDPAEPSGLTAALEAASFPQDAPPLYGDGHSAARIAEALYTLPRS